MDSKKKISISFRNQEQKKDPYTWNQAKEEQAAAKEEKSESIYSESEEHPKPQIYQLPVKKKKKKQKSPVKHLVMTTATALLISLGLGFLLLRMFVTLTDQTTTGADAVPSSPSVQVASEETASVTATPIEGYFVQAGVFSTEDKASEWKLKLTALSISSVVWERDGQYYLFTGSAATESEANNIAESLSGRIETYVKPWTILKEPGELQAGEAEVVSTLIQHLEDHSMAEITEKQRQSFIKTLEEENPDSPLLPSLKNWEASDDHHLNWLHVAHAVEEMMK